MMGYYVYTVDDLKESLKEIHEHLDSVSCYLEDSISSVNCMEDDYDYYNGSEFYEDLNFSNEIADVVNMVKQIDNNIKEFKEDWNEKMNRLKKFAEDRFQDQYSNAILEEIKDE